MWLTMTPNTLAFLVDTRRGTERFDCVDANDSEAHPKLNLIISAQFISIMNRDHEMVLKLEAFDVGGYTATKLAQVRCNVSFWSSRVDNYVSWLVRGFEQEFSVTISSVKCR